jgi:hypothetical protein
VTRETLTAVPIDKIDLISREKCRRCRRFGWKRATRSANFDARSSFRGYTAKRIVTLEQGDTSMHGPSFDSLERRTLFAAISGVVFDDLNGNGVRETGEPGRAGAALFIDLNQNGFLDKKEPRATTDAGGAYTFPDVTDGRYQLRLEVPTGRRLTAPASIASSVDVNSESNTVQAPAFGDTTTGVIRGMVFTDTNQDALRQSNEPGLPGWTVFLDKDGDGLHDSNEKVRVTNSRGEYRFSGLTPGTYYLRVVQQNGFARTNPLSGVWVVKNLTFAQSFSNRNIGQRDLDEERP